MMPLKLTYDLIEEAPKNFVGWINEVEGVIAQGTSPEEVRTELLKILRIKWELDRKEKEAVKKERSNTKTEDLFLQPA